MGNPKSNERNWDFHFVKRIPPTVLVVPKSFSYAPKISERSEEMLINRIEQRRKGIAKTKREGAVAE